jgi:hypothetical protein
MSQYTNVTVELRAGECFDEVAPLPLQPFIPSSQWSSFGKKINTALHQLDHSTQCYSAVLCGSVLGFFLFGVGGYVSVSTFQISPMVPVGLVLFGGSPFAYMCMESQARRNFANNVKQICGNANFRNVTVHYKERIIGSTSHTEGTQGTVTTYYLEFICGVYSPPSISATIAVPVSADSVKKRLRELEELKECLTVDEYAEKRRGIIATMV